MRKIAIIDSGFDDRHPKVKEMWEGFDYRKIDLVGESDYHPHGTMVANLCFRPFDNDLLRDKVQFLHIRAATSDGQFSIGTVDEAFHIVEEEECTAVNCSWGAPKPTRPEHEEMALRVLTLVEKGITWHWAAGNEDNQDLDEDLSRPQALLQRGMGTYLWGALSKEGKPAWFSSDGDTLFASMWGEDRPVHGVDGKIAGVSGTSFASPSGCGMCEALLALDMFSSYVLLEDNLLAVAINLTKQDGTWTEYHDPITGLKWHPKTGAGSLEHLYQGLTASARCRPHVVPKAAARWFNFRKL